MATSEAMGATRAGRRPTRAVMVNDKRAGAASVPGYATPPGLFRQSVRREKSDSPSLRLLRGEQIEHALRPLRDGDTIDVSTGELEVLCSPQAAEAQGLARASDDEPVVTDWISVDRPFLTALAGSCGVLAIAMLIILTTGGVPGTTHAKVPSVATPAQTPSAQQVVAATPSVEEPAEHIAASPKSSKRLSAMRTRSSHTITKKTRITKRTRASRGERAER